MDVGSFSSGQESCRKARPRLTDLSGSARQAPRRVAFSLVTFSWPFKRKPLARRRRTKAFASQRDQVAPHESKRLGSTVRAISPYPAREIQMA